MGRGKGTNTADKAMILEWLKQKGNFDHIEGRLAQSQSVVAGNRLTKDSAYAKLSDYIEKKTGQSKVSRRVMHHTENHTWTRRKTVLELVTG